MQPVLFIDGHCAVPYDHTSLSSDALGGTEATVIRIAEKLSERVPVVVLQDKRQSISKSKNVSYCPMGIDIESIKWQAIIAIRNPPLGIMLRSLFKDTPIWVWVHDLITLFTLDYLRKMADKGIGYIVVSDFQKKQIEDLQEVDAYLPVMPIIKRIYNPIDDDLLPDDTQVDLNKLAFISAPLKGLEYTLHAFQIAREANPDFELWVANPGYQAGLAAQANLQRSAHPNVRFLGGLSHRDCLKLVRQSLCLFYLNPIFPETFGLVLAESNAVGTPVLAHPLGAVQEVVLDKRQVMNTYDLPAVIERLMQWHAGERPKVEAVEAFRLSNIIEHWHALLLTTLNP